MAVAETVFILTGTLGNAAITTNKRLVDSHAALIIDNLKTPIAKLYNPKVKYK